MASEVFDVSKETNLIKSSDNNLYLIEKSFNLSNFHEDAIEVIKNKAVELYLHPEVIDDAIQVVGEQVFVFEFIMWLYDFLNKSLPKQKEKSSQDEVSISTFHRLKKADILKKAQSLSLICDFRYHTILVTGLRKNIRSFKDYLVRVETVARKALYPKYWDFEDTEMYSEIDVLPESPEFAEITARMRQTIPDAEILTLTRIQNNYLLAQYITNLGMRQEIRSEYLDRKLLFHGTRNIEPRKIHGNFDTGFDLRKAKDSGMFGKGIYFAHNASYSHNFSYKVSPSQGRYRMILAEVFLGKSYDAKTSLKVLTAPDGFDSICYQSNFHIIYNNFHSYPLYSIEYKTSQPINLPSTSKPLTSPLSQVPLKNKTKISENKSNIPNPETLKRIKKELLEVQKEQSLQNIFVSFPDEKDLTKWIVNILGPEDTPYEAGIFRIEVNFSEDYPLNPPNLTFLTCIYHPCIDSYGKVCLGLLKQWTPILTMRSVLLCLSVLFNDPSLEEPLMPEISSQYQNDRRAFLAKAREWTDAYAQ